MHDVGPQINLYFDVAHAPAIIMLPDTAVRSKHVFNGERVRFGIPIDIYMNALKKCGLFGRCWSGIAVELLLLFGLF